jgi:hypothetical protein
MGRISATTWKGRISWRARPMVKVEQCCGFKLNNDTSHQLRVTVVFGVWQRATCYQTLAHVVTSVATQGINLGQVNSFQEVVVLRSQIGRKAHARDRRTSPIIKN